jgi:hypothetical protein
VRESDHLLRLRVNVGGLDTQAEKINDVTGVVLQHESARLVTSLDSCGASNIPAKNDRRICSSI